MKKSIQTGIGLCLILIFLAVDSLAVDWTGLAAKLLSRGRYLGAVNALLSARGDSDSTELQLMTGHAYAALGYPLHARHEYDACLPNLEDPGQKAEALAGLGLVSLLTEDVSHAQRLIGQAGQLAADNHLMQLAAGLLALDKKESEAALQAGEYLAAQSGFESAGLALAGMAAAQMGQNEKAEKFLGRLLKRVDEQHPLYLMTSYRVKYHRNDINGALADLEALQGQLAGHARLAAEHARLLAKYKGHHEAISRLEPALKVSPGLPYLLRLRAEFYLGEAVPGRAAEDLEQLVAGQKAISRDFILLAEAYRQMRKHDRWRELAQTLIDKRPDAPEGPYLLGACREDLADADGARQGYSQALAGDAFFTPALLARADLNLRENRREEARADVQEVLRIKPNDQQALLLSASLDLLDGQYEQAETQLRLVLADEPDHWEAMVLLVTVLQHQDRQEEARTIQNELRYRPVTPIQVFRGLLVMYEQGQYRRMNKVARAFLTDHPTDYRARAMLIDALLELHEYEQALSELELHEKHWGRSRNTELVRAECLMELARNDEALALINKTLAQHPGDLSALYLRGVTQQRRGDLDGALADLLLLARLDTEAAAPRLALARLFLARGEHDRARAEALLYFRRTERQADGWRLRGQVELAAGHPKQAVEYLSQALQLNAEDKEALSLRAQAYESLGDEEAALADRRKLQAIRTESP